jgi:cbb3-type cytochrome oxidase subunit 3
MLRDVMQSAGLVLYAEIGLVLIFAAFLIIVVRTFAKKAVHYDHVARLPLDDDTSCIPEALARGDNSRHAAQRLSEV